MKKLLLFITFPILLFLVCGCSAEDVVRFFCNPSFDGDVAFVQEEVTVEKLDEYVEYGDKKFRNYMIKIPYVITGEVKEDIKDIPVRYDMIEEKYFSQDFTDSALFMETDALYTVMEDTFTIEKGCKKGCLTLKMDYHAVTMTGPPETQKYIWVTYQLDDENGINDYVFIINPFYEEEETQGYQEFTVPKIQGDIAIDKDNIKIVKKNADKQKKNETVHYTAQVPITISAREQLDTEKIQMGFDFFVTGVHGDSDHSIGTWGSMLMEQGICMGLQQEYTISPEEEKAVIEIDVYNTYAGGETGYDIDQYPYFWVALGITDDNNNNNYYVLHNPYFDDASYPYSTLAKRTEKDYVRELNARTKKYYDKIYEETEEKMAIVFVTDLSKEIRKKDLKKMKRYWVQLKMIDEQMWWVDRAASVVFADKAKLAWDFDLQDDANTPWLEDEDYYCGTKQRVDKGLRCGVDAFEQIDDTDNKFIVLLSDAQDNTYDKVKDEVKYAKEKGVRIVTVGITKDANTELLQQIAEETGGICYPDIDLSELPNIADAMRALVQK